MDAAAVLPSVGHDLQRPSGVWRPLITDSDTVEQPVGNWCAPALMAPSALAGFKSASRRSNEPYRNVAFAKSSSG
jgi:hypothetical protein